MKKSFIAFIAIMFCCFIACPSFAGTHGTNGKVTPKSIGAAACSLLIWPGIGQVINDQNKEKMLLMQF